jgi:hypothetical protein
VFAQAKRADRDVMGHSPKDRTARVPLPVPEVCDELFAIVTDPAQPFAARVNASRLLRAALDDFKPALVAAARREGVTWLQICRALDVSKQAAQQKYG